mmetsp:Transcript_28269/g.82677  ORF Transcript_28269/g.82677 Transcript_28269/m.82677 type:complete len:218 (-) Transcript_28269:777-1430(-)
MVWTRSVARSASVAMALPEEGGFESARPRSAASTRGASEELQATRVQSSPRMSWAVFRSVAHSPPQLADRARFRGGLARSPWAGDGTGRWLALSTESSDAPSCRDSASLCSLVSSMEDSELLRLRPLVFCPVRRAGMDGVVAAPARSGTDDTASAPLPQLRDRGRRPALRVLWRWFTTWSRGRDPSGGAELKSSRSLLALSSSGDMRARATNEQTRQ